MRQLSNLGRPEQKRASAQKAGDVADLSACGGGLIDEGVDIKAVFVPNTIGLAAFRTALEGVLVLAGGSEGDLSSFARSDLKEGLSLVRALQDDIYSHVFGCCL